MQTISGIMFQLKGQLQQIGLLPRHNGGSVGGGGDSGGGTARNALHGMDPNRNSGNWALVQAAVVAGLYPNVAHSSPGSQAFLSHDNLRARISTRSLVQPGSSQDDRIRWVVFDEVSRGAMNTDLRNVSVISPVTIFLVAGLALDIEPFTPSPVYDEETGDEIPQMESYTVALDGWCKAKMHPDSAKVVLELRKCWSEVFDETVCGIKGNSPVGLAGIENVLTFEAKGVVGVNNVEMQKLRAAGGRGRGRCGQGRGGAGRSGGSIGGGRGGAREKREGYKGRGRGGRGRGNN